MYSGLRSHGSAAEWALPDATQQVAGCIITSAAAIDLGSELDASLLFAIALGTADGDVLFALPTDVSPLVDASYVDSHVIAGHIRVQKGAVRLLATTDTADGVTEPVLLAAGSNPYAVAVNMTKAFAALTGSVAPALAKAAHHVGRGKRRRGQTAADVEAEALRTQLGFRLPDEMATALEGHTLPITAMAVRVWRHLTAVTASLDATVRLYALPSGACTRIVDLGKSRPALSLGFDASGFQRDAFYVGCVGAVCFVDLVPASRPGYFTTGRTASAAAHGVTDIQQAATVTSLQLKSTTMSSSPQHADDWFYSVMWDSTSRRVVATGFGIAEEGDEKRVNGRHELVWQPADAFVEPERSPITAATTNRRWLEVASLSEPRVRAAPSSTHGILWPPATVSGADVKEQRVEDVVPALGEGRDEEDEVEGDEDVRKLRTEQAELRAMCADLMQQRKRLRTEARVTR
jgi:hypothetical protein